MNDNELKHFGIPGMKWGVRKKTESSSGDHPRVAEAKSNLAKAQAQVDKADNDWVKAWDKNGGKEDKSATHKLNQALAAEKEAKKALKDSYKSDRVLAGEKRLKDVESKIDKADNDWAKSLSSKDKAVIQKAADDMDKLLAEHKTVRKELYNARMEPYNQRLAAADANFVKAWNAVSEARKKVVKGLITNPKNMSETYATYDEAVWNQRKAALEQDKARFSKGYAATINTIERLRTGYL